MDFILVLANVEPKEGCYDSILEVSNELIDESLLEEGNVDYKLLKSLDDSFLTFVEKWESQEALEKHMRSPHFLNFMDECDEFIENMTVQVIDANILEL
ncbi:MAG: antibiotic biosynthesis monooxygenase [Methanobrevibacter thaueri]|nr:antibiotic biosynthesis monooxygenase [Methanobrevibacter thaueri]